jgi:glutamate N-acetyltransferase/amino-acid N-acetyltransferase
VSAPHPTLVTETASTVPLGLRLNAGRAGLKASGNPDLAVAVSDQPMSAAAVFTSNQFVAAPVTIGRASLTQTGGWIRSVVVNAGNANCATGSAGEEACRAVCADAAETLACTPEEIFHSSTGIIGVPLPSEKIIAVLPELLRGAKSDSASAAAFAAAIMTTDTRPKIASASLTLAGREVRILGMGKGAGMIHPKLIPHATMLVYIFTDLAAQPEALGELLWASADRSFNNISIDGDTSTNDTVLLAATGASGATWENLSAPDQSQFRQALDNICISLAKQMVRDGEGVHHVVEIDVTGARSVAEARTIAKALAHSPLVKTAWAGEDPNWGRLIAAIGASSVVIDPQRLHLRYGGEDIFLHGERAPGFNAAAVNKYLQQPEYQLHVDLGLGTATCRFWTTDLTAEYVSINADYST